MLLLQMLLFYLNIVGFKVVSTFLLNIDLVVLFEHSGF